MEHLFVYGTLRKGFDHPFADQLSREADYLGVGQMAGRIYDLGSFPGMVAAESDADLVTGDVYALREHSKARLLQTFDRYEGYKPNMPKALSGYLRERKPVTLDSGDTVEAWVYIFNRRLREAVHIPSGDYLAYLKQR